MKELLYISALLCIAGCTSQPVINVDELIQSTLEKRFADFKKREISDCRANAVLEADIYVDSIIYQMTRFSVLDDSLEMITKPLRPFRPEYIEITDPGPIKPFDLDN